MMNFVQDLRSGSLTRRCLLLAFVALAFTAGGEKPAAYVAVPFSTPEEFSDGSRLWQRSEGEPSTADNQRIGTFFKKRPELVGSPDWTGQPEKYVSNGSKSPSRFYWFSGNEENPSWNALEMDGTRIRELSGTGMPGVQSAELTGSSEQ